MKADVDHLLLLKAGTAAVMRSRDELRNEVANVGTISTVMGDSTVHTDLVATYRVDDEGKVVALRAYWSIDKLRFG